MSPISRKRLPLAFALITAMSAAVVGPVFATENVQTRRLAGADRYQTAVSIAKATFPSGSRTAVLASGERFPDALASSYLSGRLEAPLLLTPAASLSSATEGQLKAMGVSGVSIVGGPVAVSENVANRLRQLGYQVDRLAGGDRYGTARAIAEAFPEGFVGALGAGGPTAIVASGGDFPDALAGAPISYSESFPVLLTPKASLSAQAAAAFDSLAIKQVVLLGGTSAVSAEVEQSIENEGITVIRIFGQTRSETAAKIADFVVDNLGWSAAHVNLARGDAFADALAGGPHEGRERSPLLLTVNPTTLGAATADWLQTRKATVASIDVFGGRSAVADATVEAARRAATTP